LFKIVIGYFLVVDDVEGVSDGCHFAVGDVFDVRLVGGEVDDVEVLFVFVGIFLNILFGTRWLTRDLVRFYSQALAARS
jgi:hypothetical protein